MFKDCEKVKKEKKKDSFKDFKASIKRMFKGEKLKAIELKLMELEELMK